MNHMAMVPGSTIELARPAADLKGFVAAHDIGEIWDSPELRSMPSLAWFCEFVDAIAANGGRDTAYLALLDITGDSNEADFDRKIRQLVPLSMSRGDEGAQGRGAAEQHRGIYAVAALFIASGVPQERVYLWLSSSDAETELPPDQLLQKANDLYEKKHWWERDYTLARHCYTALGAKPLGGVERARLMDIYQVRDENMQTLVRGIVFAVCVIVFTSVFGDNVATGTSVTGQAAICIALTFVVLALAFWRFRQKPFNGLSGLVPVLFALWLVFAILAV